MNDTTRNPEASITRSIGDESERRAARNTLIAWRRSMDAPVRRAADAAIAARLEAWLQAWFSARPAAERVVLGAYWPVRGEPDLREAMARWHAAGSAIVLPRVAGADRALQFGRWRPGAPMRDDVFGIPIPDPFEPLRPTLMIVPCVGFDARGYRLGYGGGFYDRTLAAWPTVVAIGVAYDACEIEAFVPAAHDRRLAAIVTETRTVVANAA